MLNKLAKLLLYRFLPFAVALLGLIAYSQWDASANYSPTEARVLSVASSCYMEKKDSPTKKRTRTPDGPCDEIRALRERDPEWRRGLIVDGTRVKVQYRSPSDGKSRRGELRFIGGAQRDQRIKILVANDDPTKIRQP
jgi:hypothetical protein